MGQINTQNELEPNQTPLRAATRTVLLDRKGFGRLLERAARDCGSKAELARRLNVTGQFIARLISGEKNPGPKLLAAFGARRKVMIEIEVEDGHGIDNQ